MQYVLRADEPFKGYVQSVLRPDGTVAYSDGLTLEEYAEAKGFPIRVIDDAELDALIADHTASLVTEPTPESLEAWEYALNVLPPCRWRTVGGVELFHISERLTHDLVSWHGRIGDRCFAFTDRAGADMTALAEKVARAAKAGQP
jgi:hypothetical protein